jgi:hypothetical protein
MVFDKKGIALGRRQKIENLERKRLITRNDSEKNIFYYITSFIFL